MTHTELKAFIMNICDDFSFLVVTGSFWVPLPLRNDAAKLQWNQKTLDEQQFSVKLQKERGK